MRWFHTAHQRFFRLTASCIYSSFKIVGILNMHLAACVCLSPIESMQKNMWNFNILHIGTLSKWNLKWKMWFLILTICRSSIDWSATNSSLLTWYFFFPFNLRSEQHFTIFDSTLFKEKSFRKEAFSWPHSQNIDTPVKPFANFNVMIFNMIMRAETSKMQLLVFCSFSEHCSVWSWEEFTSMLTLDKNGNYYFPHENNLSYSRMTNFKLFGNGLRTFQIFA